MLIIAAAMLFVASIDSLLDATKPQRPIAYVVGAASAAVFTVLVTLVVLDMLSTCIGAP